jgi:hypothetical protein
LLGLFFDPTIVKMTILRRLEIPSTLASLLNKRKTVSAAELASLAKNARQATRKTRQQAAEDMGVSWTSIFQAEEEPKRSLLGLRRRMIKRYAGLNVEGPFFLLSEDLRTPAGGV